MAFVLKDFRNVPQALRPQQLKGARAFAQRVGTVMAQEANNEIGIRFRKRVFERRRYPGTRRAQGAVKFSVEGRDFPISVDFRVVGGAEVTQRIQILNFGPERSSYQICSTDYTGNEPWALKNVSSPNRFRGRDQIRDLTGRRGYLAWREGYNAVVIQGCVLWREGPAVSKRGFLEVAREKAIQKVRAEFR